MKKSLVLVAVCISAVLLLNGCIVLSLGGGTKNTSEASKVTLGQQLMDLQKAKDSGAITDAEYQAQKAKLLNQAK